MVCVCVCVHLDGCMLTSQHANPQQGPTESGERPVPLSQDHWQQARENLHLLTDMVLVLVCVCV